MSDDGTPLTGSVYNRGMSNNGYMVAPSSYGDENRLVGWGRSDSRSVTHDAKGNQTGLPSNLTTPTSGLALEWDFENKLHATDVDGTSGADILQKFDALGRRISRDDGTTTTVYVPSDQQIIADYTAGTAASSPTYRYVYASYIDEPVMRAGSTSTAKLYCQVRRMGIGTLIRDVSGMESLVCITIGHGCIRRTRGGSFPVIRLGSLAMSGICI